MGMKNPVVATCPKCGKPNVLICTACGLCGACRDHDNCNADISIDGSAYESLDFEMILVEGGTFQMGSEEEEETLHSVTVSSFYIGKYPVTWKEWKKVMGSNPSEFEGSLRPVENISWYAAVQFCNELSQKEGLTPAYKISGTNVTCNWQADGYRLPTEAEWEFAARGGNLSKGYNYSGSNSLDEVSWYWNNSKEETHIVGGKEPNELGIYDMSGNVWEWCWDWYDEYPSSSQTNPKGASNGSDRVIRGGSWSYLDGGSCRVADRVDYYPGLSCDDLGFRLARTPMK